ncbi:MAG: low-complexity tail membrane protein [Elainellaceae cyanobacterium]
MRSFWFDPYLWIHLAGAAAVPIWLEICFLGLALGDPLLPPGLEIFLVAAVGVVPTLWMQWRRPFYIFSLLVVALKAGALTADQRRLLRFFKSFQTKVLALVVPVMLTYLLWLLYQAAPLATDTLATLPIPQWHLLGLLVAAIAFLLANLFLQVPVSVLRVMLASEQAVAQADPYPIDQISLNFTSIGFEVARILPPIEVAPPSPPAPLTPPAGADLGAAEASLDEADPGEGDEPTIDDAALSAGESNQGVAETEVTETGAPETEAPKTEAPETEATETEVTETEETETDEKDTKDTEKERTET